MSRNDRGRRKARRLRKLTDQAAHERVAEELRQNPAPINFSRLRQLFWNMSFRSNVKGGSRPFADLVIGPHVEASTPEELVVKTAALLRDNSSGSTAKPGVKEPLH